MAALCMPSVEPKVSRAQRHPWTMTPDVDFIVDRHGSIIGGKAICPMEPLARNTKMSASALSILEADCLRSAPEWTLALT